jgi:hypothetical protein
MRLGTVLAAAKGQPRNGASHENRRVGDSSRQKVSDLPNLRSLTFTLNPPHVWFCSWKDSRSGLASCMFAFFPARPPLPQRTLHE